MQGILAQLFVLFIVLCGLSVMVSQMFGRGMDPFFLTRPFARWGMRLPARVCRRLSRLSYRLSDDAWQYGMRTPSLLLKWILFPTWGALVLAGVLVSIPAEIFGEVQRR